MVSSVLSPEKVVGRQNTNRAAAQNFISGGSLLGASVVNSAANKIVGFQRAGVQPAAPAIDSIVSTISTNINNNVNNTVNKTLQGFSADYQRRVKEFDINKITTNVNNTVNKTLQGFSTDYQNRIKQVDDAKPIGILGKFLNVYKTALGFINFFGNKKNIDKVRDSLEALKKSFTESFEVAKLIRQVIIKIVKQLSNLPVASPSGGGGLNLDVDIPGGGLKKSAPRGLGRMMGGGKGKMLALGAGALGLGAAGAGAVNALSDSPQVQAAGTSPEIPGDIADRFSSIVDRFANAISKLFETNKQKSKQQQQQSSGGKGEKKQKEKEDKTKPSGETGSPGAMPTVSGEGTPEQQALLKSLRFAEGTSKSYGTIFGGNSVKELEEGKLTVQETINMADTGKLPQRLGGGTVPGYGKGSKATGAYQFMPGTLEGLIKNGSLKGDELFTNKVQDRAALQLAANRGVTTDLLKKEGFSANVSNKLAPEWASVPTKSGTSYYGQPVKSLSSIQKVYAQSLKQPSATQATQAATPQPSATQAPQATPQAQAAQKPGVQVAATPQAQAQAAQVEAAKTAQTQVAQRAAAVSQTAQSQPQVNYLPIDMSGGGQQQTGGGGGSSGGGGGGSQGSGPSVPFLPAGNPNNFLVLYSRMVYNIVDG